MENFIYLLKFAIFSTVISGVVFVLYIFFRYQYGIYQKEKLHFENLYNMKYLWLQSRINDYPISEYNYKFIMMHLVELSCMKYKNREKTTVLTMEFLKKYATSLKEWNSQDEFSPEQVFN